MSLLNLMTAVYWGQLSACTPYAMNFAQYSCSQPSAYAAVCAFAVFLFLVQSFFTGAVYLWRGELISEDGVYDEIPRKSPYDMRGQSMRSQPSSDL